MVKHAWNCTHIAPGDELRIGTTCTFPCTPTRQSTWLRNFSQSILTYSTVQSPSWEANWFAASQEISPISRNPKVHYRTHKRPPPVSILGQPNPVHIHTSHLLEIRSNIIRPSTPRSPQWSPFSSFACYSTTPWLSVRIPQKGHSSTCTPDRHLSLAPSKYKCTQLPLHHPLQFFLKVLHSMKAFTGEKEPVVSNTIPRLSSLYLSHYSVPCIGVGSN